MTQQIATTALKEMLEFVEAPELVQEITDGVNKEIGPVFDAINSLTVKQRQVLARMFPEEHHRMGFAFACALGFKMARAEREIEQLEMLSLKEPVC